MRRTTATGLVISAATLLATIGGCAKYITPGGPADFRALGITSGEAEAMTDKNIAARLARKPAANFPAGIATVRVQAGGYRSHTWTNPESPGRYSVVTTREVEGEETFERLTTLPMIRGIAPINRLVAPPSVNTEMDIRSIAADLQADIVLLYTFDTTFGSETIIPALGTITLGIFPAEEARVTSTASAALIDTRTGFVYGLAESTARTEQLANAWTTGDAIDQSRRRAEKRAFEGLIGELEKAWPRLVSAYGPGSAPPIVPLASMTDGTTEGAR
ncbi:MAG: hypothetical protein H7Y88_07760 [Phycisphaerales bacterium]|nr:hypothetical protein [Phycisphaerales bacterium]